MKVKLSTTTIGYMDLAVELQLVVLVVITYMVRQTNYGPLTSFVHFMCALFCLVEVIRIAIAAVARFMAPKQEP